MTWTILRITVLRLRNNPLELALIFVVPIVFFSIFAMIFSKGIATGQNIDLKIGWVDAAQSDLSLELLLFLSEQDQLSCESLGAAKDDRQAANLANDARRRGQFDLIVRIPEDLAVTETERREIFLISDGQNPMALSMVESLLRSFFARSGLSELLKRNRNMTQRLESTLARPVQNSRAERPDLVRLEPPTEPDDPPEDGEDNASAQQLDVDRQPPPAADEEESRFEDPFDAITLTVERPAVDDHANPRVALYAAGIAVLFLLFSSTGTAATLLEERESGTLDRILASHADLFELWSGKWIGIFLLGCLQISIMFIWAAVVFDVPLFQHLGGFAVMTLATSTVTSSFAMLLATVCRSRAQLNAVSTIVILSMSAVGGSMIPRFVMSQSMKDFGRWTFNAWALDGFQKVFWYQLPVSSLRLEVLVLVSASVILSFASLFFAYRWNR